MSRAGSLRESPPVRDLLARATWADLERIAARHGVAIGGRRRELYVERLGALLERREQLQAAVGALPPHARAVLSVMLLLGSAEDERSITAARDRLVAARPELAPVLGRAYVAQDLQTLTSLGLVFAERRAFLLPREVLNTIAPSFPPASPVESADVSELSYAELRYTLDALIAAVRTRSPVALQPPRAATDRATSYKPLLLPPDVAQAIGRDAGVAADRVTLLLSLLGATGAIAPIDGVWRVQPASDDFRESPPRAQFHALLDGWRGQRSFSDVARTTSWAWFVAPEGESEAITALESSLRGLVWRWLRWCGDTMIAIADLSRMLHTLHPALLPTEIDGNVWIGPAGWQARTSGSEALYESLIREIVDQLVQLGLVASDGDRCRLSWLALWLDEAAEIAPITPIIKGEHDIVQIDPLHVAPDVLRLIVVAGQPQPPGDGYARYKLTPHGMSRLLARGVSVAEFEQALIDGGARLDESFLHQLAAWSERVGRLRLHQPLTILLTAENAPLQQILQAAGVADDAEIIGPGCALMLPEAADAAVDALRSRGFWPRTT